MFIAFQSEQGEKRKSRKTTKYVDNVIKDIGNRWVEFNHKKAGPPKNQVMNQGKEFWKRKFCEGVKNELETQLETLLMEFIVKYLQSEVFVGHDQTGLTNTLKHRKYPGIYWSTYADVLRYRLWYMFVYTPHTFLR